MNGTTVQMEIRISTEAIKHVNGKPMQPFLTTGLARMLELGVQCGSEFPGSQNKKSFGGKKKIPVFKETFHREGNALPRAES